ncbi:hypothetical protein MSPP1_003375 [Malassezia sp. CBS 17886]|nr:hypothetical protein MSPP1_003375 [Malassezia sp. CBS 17886]
MPVPSHDRRGTGRTRDSYLRPDAFMHMNFWRQQKSPTPPPPPSPDPAEELHNLHIEEVPRRSTEGDRVPLLGPQPIEARIFEAMHRRREFSRARSRRRLSRPLRFARDCVHRSVRLWAKHPVAMTAGLLVFSLFATCVGFLIKYILDPDKERMPWRQDCAAQPNFVNAAVDNLAPVDLFVGVLTMDRNFERRQVIRDTYASLTLPLDAATGQPLGNVQVKFVLGRPARRYADRIALEMEMYNDIVVLDAPETGSSQKTLNFFRWAAENATVPVLVGGAPRPGAADESLPGAVRWKLADYVLKADDDAFIVLDQLERYLRAAPRTMVYWGYLVRGWFMAGECYAVSYDLVRYVATSPAIARMRYGKEDSKMAKWMRMHPDAARIQWVSEHCWIYDHPRARTPYAHGFLFPDHVQEIKREFREGIPEVELQRRGGPHNALAYSTTSKWRKQYAPPRRDLSVEERIEALIEGGGRWPGTWRRSGSDRDTQRWLPRSEMVLTPDDPRLRTGNPAALPKPAAAVVFGAPWDIPSYPNSTALVDPAPPTQKRVADPLGRNYADMAAQLRSMRHMNDQFGGTVVVHYCKKHEYFYETALALLGRDRTWRRGGGGAGREWRMDGSPRVQPYSNSHAYIANGQPSDGYT